MPSKKFSGLLLDLDGTLLQVDVKVFIPQYVQELAIFFSPLIEPEVFSRELYATTRKVVENTDAHRNNEEIFWEEFCRRLDIPQEKARPWVEEFYAREYPKLQYLTSPHPQARELLKVAANKNLRTVIATNPIFPRVAIEERLRWAEIEDFTFDLITTLENMHFCKPQLQYYQEIARTIQIPPTNCLMAGNDVSEDLVASQVGMYTYLVEDDIINSENIKPHSTWRGKLKDLKEFLAAL